MAEQGRVAGMAAQFPLLPRGRRVFLLLLIGALAALLDDEAKELDSQARTRIERARLAAPHQSVS